LVIGCAWSHTLIDGVYCNALLFAYWSVRRKLLRVSSVRFSTSLCTRLYDRQLSTLLLAFSATRARTCFYFVCYSKTRVNLNSLLTGLTSLAQG